MLERAKSPSLWLIVLASSVGVAAGVAISAGVGFDKADSARFIGSLLGSIIAISGAVALHYLKDAEDRSKKRKHLVALLKIAKGICPLCIEDIKKKDKIESAISVFVRQFDRCVSYAEKYQFEDYAIHESYSWISENVTHLLKFDEELFRSEGFVELACEIVRSCERSIDRSLAALKESDSKLKVLS